LSKITYLAQTLQFGRNNFEDEVNRRIQLSWTALGKLRRVFSSLIPQSLKTKVFNQFVLPVMTYEAEPWTLLARLVYMENELWKELWGFYAGSNPKRDGSAEN
jgi:hypothetical protein